MKKAIIGSSLKQKFQQYIRTIFVSILAATLFSACQEDLPNNIMKSGSLALTASKTGLVLNQKEVNNVAVDFSWTTGTNHGTESSISYTLQVDKKGNRFSNSISLDMGKGIYLKSYNVGALNDSLLTHWSITPGSAADLEARVIATVYSEPVIKDTSNVLTISVTTYKPVSKTLYLFGSASPKGTDLNNALQLKAQSDPTIFVYQGVLGTGNLKFITTLGQLLPSYQMGANASRIVYRSDLSQSDNMFSIVDPGVYKVTVSLLDLTVNIVKADLPPYTEIYMVGDASPNGWDIGNATPLIQNATNPFIFSYTGVMQKGDFKFPVNRNTNWGQDMYMRTDDTHMYLHHGGGSDDSKWTIAKKGYYTITLNMQDNTISINREKLYMVGDATSIGWTITSAIPMTEDATNGCIFTYTGPMLVGSFKFPVNLNSDWGQDMYERTDDTHMYRHIGGQADDNKWSIVTAGNYIITANIETLAISYVKQ
jgi:starch-binding outer membrane protein SusE/F